MAELTGDEHDERKATPAKAKPSKNQIAYDESHGDLQALKAAGVPIPRSVALAQAHGVQHPAIGKGKQSYGNADSKNPSPAFAQAVAGQNAGVGVSKDPSDPAQYAANVLTLAGLPNTKSNEALLERQMTEEGMPGGEDNPLATTLKQPGSTSVNSAGVQQYPNLEEGAYAEAQTLKQSNMQSIYNALLSGNAPASEYAAALEGSDYEGLGGSSNPANVAYGEKYLGDNPSTSFGGGGASSGYTPIGTVGSDPTTATQQLGSAMGTDLFSGLQSTIPQLGSSGANQSLQSALAGLSGNAEQSTLAANTSDAPGSPDQTNSQTQQTNVPNSAQYQAALAALLPNIKPGAAK